MEYNGYNFQYLSIAEMRSGIEQRITQYEGKIFDAMMNQKAEAATSNPRRSQAVAELQRQIVDINSAIDTMKSELEMLEMAEQAEHLVETPAAERGDEPEP